jgi:TPR repeat protein
MPYHWRLALHLYAAAGTCGSPEGYYNHGHLLWDASQFTRAMESFYKAMELGDADAMYFVAAQYLSYEEEHEDSDNEAGSGVKNNKAFSLTAIHEDHGATVMEMLHSSNVPSIDTPTSLPMKHPIHQHGLSLLQHAAHEYKHGPALHHLALLHNEHGKMHDFCNYLTKAANLGNPDSLFLRGHCRYFGTDGFDRDPSAAMADFLLAVDNGHVDAMVSAGALLHRGVMSEDGKKIIIKRDQRQAFELYQRAGELGSIEGWRNVVRCYATGEGVPMCMDTAKYIANTMLKDDKDT